MKKNLLTILLVTIMVLGALVMLYPTVSNYVNSRAQSHMVTSYTSSVKGSKDYSAEWEAARAFNASLNAKGNCVVMTDSERAAYETLLNIDGTGMMGVIEIPKINVSLPLYHGTSDSVLQRGVGHLEGTSLPTGDVGTHPVFSGHRGLPSAKLFTDLDKVEVGDRFTVSVYDQKLIYEVDQILVVLPEETEALAIDPEQELCTLVTCTPYGVNSHRMLVRGHRVQESSGAALTSDLERIDTIVSGAAAAVPLAVLLVIWFITSLVGKHGTTKRKER